MLVKGSILLLLLYFLRERIKNSVTTSAAEKEYDFIIVGGGTTGAALASRLSEDPNVKVLLLEAGKSDEHYPMTRIPSFDTLTLSEANWDFKTVPQRYSGQALVDKKERWPRGKLLGGTSSLNYMIYSRGSPHDYDSWEDHGAAGWNWENVKPYFVKLEGAGPDLSPSLGRDGPVKLSKAYAPAGIGDILKIAAQEVGLNVTDYIESLEGISDAVSTVDANGLRVNSVQAYLTEHFPERKNRLHVVCEAHVTKVLFNESAGDEPVAIGVEFQKDGAKHKAYAKKEVILSTGVIGTPHLLMLSGIGPKEQLNEFNISLIADSPGVGQNLKDHIRLLYYLYADKLPENYSLTFEEQEASVSDYIANGDGPMTNKILYSIIHYRTRLAGTPVSLSTNKRPFPEMQIALFPIKILLADMQEHYDAQTFDFSNFAGEAGKALSQRKGVLSNTMLVTGLQHPKSSGTIKLQSSDPFVPPLIDPAFFSNQDDVDVFVEGLKKVENLIDSEQFKKLGYKQVFQPFCKEFGTERPWSDDYLKCWIKKLAVSEYHPCCTAKMGEKSDKTAVLDERLRVRKVKRLRVADASVMPHDVTGNPQGACYMIAEKAADMIKEDWAE